MSSGVDLSDVLHNPGRERLAEIGVSWSSNMPTFWKAVAKKASPEGRYDSICEQVSEGFLAEMILTVEQMMTNMTDV